MRRWLEQNGVREKYAQEALEMVSKKFPSGTFDNWSVCNDLLVHAESVLYMTATSVTTAARINLLRNVAHFEGVRRQYASAETRWHEVATLLTDGLGEAETNTERLQALDGEALAMLNQGKLDEADEVLRKIMKFKEACSGLDRAEIL
jgi:hypothetical protein